MNAQDSPVKPRILVAPLDWGLGHATRCIPIIRQLLHHQCEVWLAGEGRQEVLLRTEFPDLTFLPLKGYNVEYGKSRWDLLGKMALQVPRLLQTIDEEHRWLEEVQEYYRFDAVISDNRYGLSHEDVHSVFITHQLRIKTPFGGLGEGILQKLNNEFIDQFSECWVPDVAEEPNLSGDLSHSGQKPSVPLHYIGPLSRFTPAAESTTGRHLLVLLSGPEPQRTILEELVLGQLTEYKEPVVVVRGLPGAANTPEVPAHIRVFNHLPAADLQQVIEDAHLVIARCGYSTVMDLMTLQKRSILIPTPGQTEQEYLAEHLMLHALAFCIPQSRFRLAAALELSAAFNYRLQPFTQPRLLESAIAGLVHRLQPAPEPQSNE